MRWSRFKNNPPQRVNGISEGMLPKALTRCSISIDGRQKLIFKFIFYHIFELVSGLFKEEVADAIIQTHRFIIC